MFDFLQIWRKKFFKNSVTSSRSHIIFLIKKILELNCSADYSLLKFYCYFDIFPHMPFSVLFPDSVKDLHCITISYEDTNLAQFAISELSLLIKLCKAITKKKKTRKWKIGNGKLEIVSLHYGVRNQKKNFHSVNAAVDGFPHLALFFYSQSSFYFILFFPLYFTFSPPLELSCLIF